MDKAWLWSYPYRWVSQYGESLNLEVYCKPSMSTICRVGIQVFHNFSVTEMWLELAKRDDIEALRAQ